MSTKHGWTTWDPSSITVWEHLPSGLRCHLVLQDAASGRTLAPTGWEPLEDTLPDDDGRSVTHLRLMVGPAEVEIECGGFGDVGACRVAQVLGDTVLAHWEVEGSLEGWQVRRGDTEIIFAPEHAAMPEDIAGFLRELWETAGRRLPHGALLLDQPVQAMEAAIALNTVTLPETDTRVTTSRYKASLAGAWSVPNWETFLTALGIAYVDPQLALDNIRTAMRLLATDGLLAAQATAQGPRRDLSNPPVAAYCVWKIFQMTGDASLVRECYPTLLRWHDWWLNFRDGNQNHLLNWASTEETGMPGHPLYDAASTDPATGMMRIDDVGLCSLWALDAFALMRIALQLDDLDRATHLETELNDMGARLNLMLWESQPGIFISKDWDGYPADRQSATILLALAAGVPTPKHLQRLLDEHLTVEFATPYLLPTLGKDDPAFQQQLHWRGRVSPLLNFLVCEGFRQFGLDEWAETVTLSGLEMLSRSWQDHHHIYDSYHAVEGIGHDIPQDPLAPGGVLFGALGIAMLMDAEPWNGLRMGNLAGVEMSIADFPLHDNLYNASSGAWGFAVTRNGAPWLDFDKPAILRNLAQTGREISCSVKLPGGGNIHLRFHGYTPGERMVIKVNGTVYRAKVNAAGTVECDALIDARHRAAGNIHRAA